MKREIKFRGWDGGMWRNVVVSGDMWTANIVEDVWHSGTVMQYTGLTDKKGTEIYEGDIVKFYTLERSIQQSHPDINPEIDTCIIRENKDVVVFNDGAFRVKDLVFDYIGQEDIDSIKEACGCVDDEICDINGNEIDESILGIEVIGNIYEKSES